MEVYFCKIKFQILELIYEQNPRSYKSFNLAKFILESGSESQVKMRAEKLSATSEACKIYWWLINGLKD